MTIFYLPLFHTGDFNQGLRRLGRSFTDSVIASSNIENSCSSQSSETVSDEDVKELKEHSANKILQNVPLLDLNKNKICSIQRSKKARNRSSSSSNDSIPSKLNSPDDSKNADNADFELFSSPDVKRKRKRTIEKKEVIFYEAYIF